MVIAMAKTYATKALRHKYYFKKIKTLRLCGKNQKTFATLFLYNFEPLQKTFATLSLCSFAPFQQKLIFTKWY
ncbi:hypothetical protein BOW55_08570 [Flavobacterium sp. YO12]|nr:hypothetical protein BOW55_08570 [Flavobacterium sp. YO12]